MKRATLVGSFVLALPMLVTLSQAFAQSHPENIPLGTV